MAFNENAFVQDLAELRAFMDIPTGITTYDSELERLMNTASTMIERRLDRVIVRRAADIEEIQDGRGTNELLLKEWPAEKPSNVYLSCDWQFDANSEIDSADYIVLRENVLKVRGCLKFVRGNANIKIVYQAGYSTVPTDLQHIAMLLMQYLDQQRVEKRIGRSSINKSGETISFVDGIPQEIDDMLDPYKRHDLALSNAIVENV